MLLHKDYVTTIFDEEKDQRGSSSWKDEEKPLQDDKLQNKRADPLYTDKVLIYIRVKDTFHKVGALLTVTSKNFS